MPAQEFNSAVDVELQLTNFSCSVGATFWCLKSLGVVVAQAGLQQLMVPSLVSPDLGLLDASGATIARLLRDQFGLVATNAPQVSFDQVAARAGRQPIAMGGRRWHVDPDSGKVVGHWVAVRGCQDDRLVLANPAGSGPNYGQQSLDRGDFASRGPFSAVWIELAEAPRGRLFRVANTDGQGANVRPQPNATASALEALREGSPVSGDEHAWRRVTDADGASGWVANEYLAGVDGRLRIANTDGRGANLRPEPAATGLPLKLLAEGSQVSADEHAWRHVTTANGADGWVADEFLSAAS